MGRERGECARGVVGDDVLRAEDRGDGSGSLSAEGSAQARLARVDAEEHPRDLACKRGSGVFVSRCTRVRWRVHVGRNARADQQVTHLLHGRRAVNNNKKKNGRWERRGRFWQTSGEDQSRKEKEGDKRILKNRGREKGKKRGESGVLGKSGGKKKKIQAYLARNALRNALDAVETMEMTGMRGRTYCGCARSAASVDVGLRRARRGRGARRSSTYISTVWRR